MTVGRWAVLVVGLVVGVGAAMTELFVLAAKGRAAGEASGSATLTAEALGTVDAASLIVQGAI